MASELLRRSIRLDEKHQTGQESALECGYGERSNTSEPTRCEAWTPQIPSPRIKVKGFESSKDWMSRVPDDTPLSNLTIPGTHDSAAYTYAWPFIATQKLTIKEQLNLGIRYFDIRCGVRDNVLELVHGPTYLGMTFAAVLEVMYEWLDQHASEALLVQMKEDRESQRSSIDFAEAVLSLISGNEARWRTSNSTPTILELRGKIQLVRRFRGPNLETYGINVTRWPDNSDQPFTIHLEDGTEITIQDHYSFTKPVPLPSLILEKTAYVNSLLDRAMEDKNTYNWYINFTSAFELNIYYQIPPHSIAVGAYWNFRRVNGVNYELRDSVSEMPQHTKRRLGVILMDFPEQGTDDLVELLIQSNFDTVDDRSRVTTFILIMTIMAVLGWLFIGPNWFLPLMHILCRSSG